MNARELVLTMYYKRKSGSYRSGLEQRVRDFLEGIRCSYEYETEKIPYIVPESSHTYTPDFILIKQDLTRMYIETKGLWDAEDRRKHFLIKQSNPGLDIRFLFSNPNSKIRKGSKISYGDVCEGKLRGHSDFIVPYAKVNKQGEVPKEWLKEIIIRGIPNGKKRTTTK